VIEQRSQVALIQRTDSLHFTKELASRRVWQSAPRMNQFECDFAKEHRIFRFITLSSASIAQPLDNAVAFKYLAFSQYRHNTLPSVALDVPGYCIIGTQRKEEVRPGFFSGLFTIRRWLRSPLLIR